MNEDARAIAGSSLVDESQPENMAKWSKVETISKTLSIAAIPFILAVGGWLIQRQVQNQAVSRDYVQLAVSILRDPDKTKVPSELREWAVDLLNDNSPTKFKPEVSSKLKAGDTTLPGDRFGDAGVVTTQVDKKSVTLNLREGEHLRYKINILGARPNFKLECEHRTLWDQNSLPEPAQVFERLWPAHPSEVDSAKDFLTFRISFTATLRYTLVVERLGKLGNVIEVIKNKAYESISPGDSFVEDLVVFT